MINSDIAEITSFPGTHLLDPTAQVDVKYEEIFLVFFILFLWAVVLRIFFQRWGQIILSSPQFHLELHLSPLQARSEVCCPTNLSTAGRWWRGLTRLTKLSAVTGLH